MKRILTLVTLFAFVATVLPGASDASPTKTEFSYKLKTEVVSPEMMPAVVDIAIPELPRVAVGEAIIADASCKAAVTVQARSDVRRRWQNFDVDYGANLFKKAVDPVPRE